MRSASSLDDIARGLEAFDAAFGRFERIAIGERRLLMLLIKNPAGANEAVRTLVDGRPPRLAVVALNDAIADGRDVSWIWDVDFEPLLDGLEQLVATGDRAAELALRFTYAGFPAERIEVVPDLERRARSRARAARAARGARPPPDVHGDARAAQDHRRRVGHVRAVLGARGVRIRVGHLYPDYLNIYADRGNIAVLARRAALRGHELEVESVSIGNALRPDAYDLLYVGGGQDREQELVAVDLVAKSHAVHAAVAEGVAALAVCGGYQLLGDFYRDRDGDRAARHRRVSPPHDRRRAAHDRRRAARLRLGRQDARGVREPRRPDEARRGRDAARAGRSHGFGNDGESGVEGCRVGRADRHVPPRAAAAAQPVARRLGARAGARRTLPGASAPELSHFADELEQRPTLSRPGARATAADATDRRRGGTVHTFFHDAGISSSRTSRRSTFGALGIAALFQVASARRADARVAEHHRRRVSGDARALAQRARRVPRRASA